MNLSVIVTFPPLPFHFLFLRLSTGQGPCLLSHLSLDFSLLLAQCCPSQNRAQLNDFLRKELECLALHERMQAFSSWKCFSINTRWARVIQPSLLSCGVLQGWPHLVDPKLAGHQEEQEGTGRQKEKLLSSGRSAHAGSLKQRCWYWHHCCPVAIGEVGWGRRLPSLVFLLYNEIWTKIQWMF